MSPIHGSRLAERPTSVLVRHLAVQATRTVDADPMTVIQIDDLSADRAFGFLFGELVYDCNDPPMFLHRASLLLHQEAASNFGPNAHY
jgi:hypothetical protein